MIEIFVDDEAKPVASRKNLDAIRSAVRVFWEQLEQELPEDDQIRQQFKTLHCFDTDAAYEGFNKFFHSADRLVAMVEGWTQAPGNGRYVQDLGWRLVSVGDCCGHWPARNRNDEEVLAGGHPC